MPVHTRHWTTRLPWSDPAGRFSVLKATCLIVTTLPAAWMAQEVLSGNWDFPSPYIGLIYHSGLWTTYFLLASLMVTPLRAISGWRRLVQLRRMLGVTCFFYCLLHLVAWFGLRFWDWLALGDELFGRLSLWLAILSMAILLALAATSFDAAMRTMGARWKQLHRLAYAAALLGVGHFLLSPGSVQGTPFLMAGLLAWALGWRLLARRSLGESPSAILGLGLIASLLALLLQPLWLMTVQAATALSPVSALLDNLNPQVWQYLGMPPVWQLLAWTLATVSISLWRQAKTSPKPISTPHSIS
ncbi:ferric reductase-like transmembrane domain-containing protein [Devosia sp. XK-2]|uniref:sulfite oxidase heme-binding subunit YedZ n=1 Tax=Devosia sp. XK-2 TaxID=3126689 RepID=UPI0030CBF693